MTWTDPRTWVAGETVTAALMNTHIRDNFKALSDPWTAYTPTWRNTSLPDPTIGNGSLTGSYVGIGKLVIFRIHLVFGSTTTLGGSGAYTWALPASAIDDKLPIGTALCVDATSPTIPSPCFVFTNHLETDRIRLRDHAAATVTSTAPFAWAAGDEINITGTYEAA